MERRNVTSGGAFEEVFGYCRGVRVGRTVHIAGTCAPLEGIDDASTYEQSVAALDIIQTALADLDATPEHVVRTVTYVTDIDDKLEVARAHSAVFGDIKPVATLVEVSALADPRWTVEIEAYAIVDEL